MRQILVDHARAAHAEKRGGRQRPLSLDEAPILSLERDETLLALDEALGRLATLDPRPAQVVELRFFGGLSIQETAAVLRVSRATVSREWTVARAWLYAELQRA